MESKDADEITVPVKPTEPLESECCGTGCSPCVFDIYKKQLKQWEEQCRQIKASGRNEENETTPENRLNPEKYLAFEILQITPDSVETFIYRFRASPINNETGKSHSEEEFPTDPLVNIGQHVVLKIENVAKQYTVLNAGFSNSFNYFDIIIKIYPKGSLTPLIGKLTTGDVVHMRGPFGKIIQLKLNEYKFVIMFAAGTGIAPMYRLIETILNNEEDNTRIILINCNRKVGHILLQQKLQEWASFWNFKVVHYLTRNGASCKLPYGIKVHLRRFTFADFSDLCSADVENSLFLVCGTKSFEKDIINYMRRAGVPSENQHIF